MLEAGVTAPFPRATMETAENMNAGFRASHLAAMTYATGIARVAGQHASYASTLPIDPLPAWDGLAPCFRICAVRVRASPIPAGQHPSSPVRLR